MKFVSLCAIAFLTQENSATKITAEWGVKDLTDEVVAFQKLSMDEQDQKIAGDSLAEAEQEMGHKIGTNAKGQKATVDLP